MQIVKSAYTSYSNKTTSGSGEALVETQQQAEGSQGMLSGALMAAIQRGCLLRGILSPLWAHSTSFMGFAPEAPLKPGHGRQLWCRDNPPLDVAGLQLGCRSGNKVLLRVFCSTDIT